MDSRCPSCITILFCLILDLIYDSIFIFEVYHPTHILQKNIISIHEMFFKGKCLHEKERKLTSHHAFSIWIGFDFSANLISSCQNVTSIENWLATYRNDPSNITVMKLNENPASKHGKQFAIRNFLVFYVLLFSISQPLLTRINVKTPNFPNQRNTTKLSLILSLTIYGLELNNLESLEVIPW